MGNLRLDHLVVVATDLTEGVSYVERQLDTGLSQGGRHALMGTHNMLLGLGPDMYLEVIAPDPNAAPPARARWFDLDSLVGLPRLANWVCQTDDLRGALAVAPAGTGAPTALERDDLRWEMAIPDDGRLPIEGLFPALIQWQGSAHPAARLPDTGIRLASLRIFLPEPQDLQTALSPFGPLAKVSIEKGGSPSMEAVFDTPQGQKVLR